MVPVPPRYWSRDSLQVNQSEERAERSSGQKLIADIIMRRVGTGHTRQHNWPWEHFIAIMTKVGYWLLRQNFNMIIPLMTALDNLKFDCSEIFIQSISFYCSAGDNWGKPRKWRRNLRVERDDPSCKLGDRISVLVVWEKYFHCSDNSEIYTDTKLPPYLASWQVYRVRTELSEVCVWSDWRMWGIPDIGDPETRHQETPGVRRGQWAQWHRVTRTRVTCHTQWHDLVRLSHTSLTQRP